MCYLFALFFLYEMFVLPAIAFLGFEKIFLMNQSVQNLFRIRILEGKIY